MTYKQKKLIFEYLGWDYCVKPLSGNDIIAAVKIIEDKGDYGMFEIYITEKCRGQERRGNYTLYLPWVLQNFFDLLGKWRQEIS